MSSDTQFTAHGPTAFGFQCHGANIAVGVLGVGITHGVHAHSANEALRAESANSAITAEARIAMTARGAGHALVASAPTAIVATGTYAPVMVLGEQVFPIMEPGPQPDTVGLRADADVAVVAEGIRHGLVARASGGSDQVYEPHTGGLAPGDNFAGSGVYAEGHIAVDARAVSSRMAVRENTIGVRANGATGVDAEGETAVRARGSLTGITASGTASGVVGKGEAAGCGGLFMADDGPALRMQPRTAGGLPAHPQVGDLCVDSDGKLWFCAPADSGGIISPTWREVALL